MIHLDTNFLIALLGGQAREKEKLRRWLRDDRPIRVSVVAWAEFLSGPVEDLHPVEVFLPPPIAFDAHDASKAAALFNATGRRSRSLQDCMIAAAAIRANAELATADVQDFRRFEKFGLRIAG